MSVGSARPKAGASRPIDSHACIAGRTRAVPVAHSGTGSGTPAFVVRYWTNAPLVPAVRASVHAGAWSAGSAKSGRNGKLEPKSAWAAAVSAVTRSASVVASVYAASWAVTAPTVAVPVAETAATARARSAQTVTARSPKAVKSSGCGSTSSTGRIVPAAVKAAPNVG